MGIAISSCKGKQDKYLEVSKINSLNNNNNNNKNFNSKSEQNLNVNEKEKLVTTVSKATSNSELEHHYNSEKFNRSKKEKRENNFHSLEEAAAEATDNTIASNTNKYFENLNKINYLNHLKQQAHILHSNNYSRFNPPRPIYQAQSIVLIESNQTTKYNSPSHPSHQQQQQSQSSVLETIKNRNSVLITKNQISSNEFKATEKEDKVCEANINNNNLSKARLIYINSLTAAKQPKRSNRKITASSERYRQARLAKSSQGIYPPPPPLLLTADSVKFHKPVKFKRYTKSISPPFKNLELHLRRRASKTAATKVTTTSGAATTTVIESSLIKMDSQQESSCCICNKNNGINRNIRETHLNEQNKNNRLHHQHKKQQLKNLSSGQVRNSLIAANNNNTTATTTNVNAAVGSAQYTAALSGGNSLHLKLAHQQQLSQHYFHHHHHYHHHHNRSNHQHHHLSKLDLINGGGALNPNVVENMGDMSPTMSLISVVNSDITRTNANIFNNLYNQSKLQLN